MKELQALSELHSFRLEKKSFFVMESWFVASSFFWRTSQKRHCGGWRVLVNHFLNQVGWGTWPGPGYDRGARRSMTLFSTFWVLYEGNLAPANKNWDTKRAFHCRIHKMHKMYDIFGNIKCRKSNETKVLWRGLHINYIGYVLKKCHSIIPFLLQTNWNINCEQMLIAILCPF